jgi:hypothetical protein
MVCHLEDKIEQKPESFLRKAEKFGRVFLLGAGISLKFVGWYYGYGEGGYHFFNKRYTKAANSYATGFAIGAVGEGFILLSGSSYLKDYLKNKLKKHKKS